TVGATARLYLVINVMQIFILDAMRVPFWVTAFAILLMILLYTFEGGVKTIVYTDTLQTSFMLIGLIVCVYYIMQNLGYNFSHTMELLDARNYTNVFNTDVNSKGFFVKQIIGGAFITIAMTGLDQEMMQKNISVKNLKDSQKNMITFSVVIVFVNFLFLLLGGLLYLFAAEKGIAAKGDDLFPTIAIGHFPQAIGIIFILGLISALFPSADGALTALTSSFCIDILGIKRREGMTEKQQKSTRMAVHLTFAVVFLLCIGIFRLIDNKSIIGIILDLAGYTYGPLLGLFAFGILTKRVFPDTWIVTAICLLSPLLSWVISRNSADWFGGYQIGIELLLINGLLTFIGLLTISKKPE
ncbi:MAG: sodium:solute symporter, partial [Gemmatimonadaceae bacterium]|nr:sodium:solute symporter [Chitinophagaceae bacterium]